jgi:archaellum component FlaC
MNLKYVDEVINEVNKVRQIIEMALLTLNVIPVDVLHPLISHYAI